MSRPWAKVWQDILHDPKVRRFSFPEKWVWLGMILSAEDTGSACPGALLFEGQAPLTAEDLAGMTGAPVAAVRSCIGKAIEWRMVDTGGPGGAWRLLAYEKRQGKPSDSKDEVRRRVAEHRARKAACNTPGNAGGNAVTPHSVTPLYRHAESESDSGGEEDLDLKGPFPENSQPPEPANTPPAEKQPTPQPEFPGVGSRASAGGDSGSVPGSTGLASMPSPRSGGGAQLPDPDAEPLVHLTPPPCAIAVPPPTDPPGRAARPGASSGGGAGGSPPSPKTRVPVLVAGTRSSALARALEEGTGETVDALGLATLLRATKMHEDFDALEIVAAEAVEKWNSGVRFEKASPADLFGFFLAANDRRDREAAERQKAADEAEREARRKRAEQTAAERAREEAERALDTPEAQAARAARIAELSAGLAEKLGGFDVAPRQTPAPNPEWTRNPEAA